MKKKESPIGINATIATMKNEIKQRRKVLVWVLKHKALFDEVGSEAQFWAGNVDFNHLTHAQVLKVMRTFKAGKWNKTVSSHSQEARIDYTATFDGVSVRCYAGHPPPSCKIVEEVVLIPAHQEVVRKLVCPRTAITQAAA